MPQIVVQVLTSLPRSLRDTINRDDKLENFNLRVEYKKAARSNGWSKLHSTRGGHGAINVHWEGAAKMLICRVVTRGGKPDLIIADFIHYLLARYGKKIESINIIPR